MALYLAWPGPRLFHARYHQTRSINADCTCTSTYCRARGFSIDLWISQASTQIYCALRGCDPQICHQRAEVCAERAEVCAERAEVCAEIAEVCTERAKVCAERAEFFTERAEVCAERAEVCAETPRMV